MRPADLVLLVALTLPLAGACSGSSLASQASCSELQDAYTNALPAALACDPGAANQCQQLASTDSQCSCGQLVQNASELDRIVNQMVAEGCIHQTACPCPIVPLVTCLPGDGGSGTCGTP
jgi:hypothetical protein